MFFLTLSLPILRSVWNTLTLKAFTDYCEGIERLCVRNDALIASSERVLNV